MMVDGFEQLVTETLDRLNANALCDASEDQLRDDVARLSCLLLAYGKFLDVQLARTRTEVDRG